MAEMHGLQNLWVTLSSQMESPKIGQEILIYILRTMMLIMSEPLWLKYSRLYQASY